MSKLQSTMKLGQSAMEFGRSAQGFAGAASEFRNADKGDMGRRAGRHVFNEGAETGKMAGKTWLKTFEVIPRMVVRGLQFLFAIIVCGFYGNRVDADRRAGDGFAPEWIFAVIVAGLSALTAVLFVAASPLGALPFVGSRMKLFKTYRAFSWDMTLFIAWVVMFGLFAGIFLKRDGDDSYKGSSTGVMKTAVWFDFVNAIFWLVTGVYGCFKTFVGDKADRLTDKVGTKLFERKQKKAEEKEAAAYAESV